MYTYLSYSDFKSNFNDAIHMKLNKKITIFSEIFLFLPVVEIILLSYKAEFCIFKNIVLSVNDFRGELCFSFFHFFISYAKL